MDSPFDLPGVPGGQGKTGVLLPAGLAVEPFGDASFTSLITLHTARADALAESGADCLLADGFGTLADMRAALIAARKCELPAVVTAAVGDGGMTAGGDSLLACLITLQSMGVRAFGLSGGAESLDGMLRELAPYATVPLFAVPDGSAAYAAEQPDSGAADVSMALASQTQVFFLTPEDMEISSPLTCSFDMAHELLELSDSRLDVIRVFLTSPDDAYWFSLNAHMAKLPVMFLADSGIALKSALLLYQGRALIDADCGLEEAVLRNLEHKYGAVIY